MNNVDIKGKNKSSGAVCKICMSKNGMQKPKTETECTVTERQVQLQRRGLAVPKFLDLI